MKILQGHFENAGQGWGYNLDWERLATSWYGGQTPIYRCWPVKEHPLQFRMRDGTLLRTTQGFPTDGGSVKPIAAQAWIPKDRFCAFLFHDDIYQHGGAWVRRKGGRWEWQPLTRSEADALLRMMCRCDPIPCGFWKAAIVWLGVRAGGWLAWDGNNERGESWNEPEEKPDVDDPPIGV